MNGHRCRVTVLVLGDGRSNYRPARPEALEAIAKGSRRVYWLNPEPRRLWDTGDSVMSAYLPFVDGAGQCQTVAQLADFIGGLDD
jgi:hypothetical protein